ncbi:2-phosphosulfolactate phosphatase [Frondihabitans sp. PhB188]|uniref:hypothetical protein n=1 Tax=Frondihabitans sp. PhB188 TaxID=2485200 RepID=UPI000F472D39|nr:hypothetical protein [Frondihabitans sp. PhB188]ROQ37324.1 2-phosphosulfolactate phosphatase [Frondihabitans sp. PhB188]
MHQERYQVRFEWGEAGARRIAEGAHVVVVADELDGHGSASAALLAAAVTDACPPNVAVLCATETSAQDAAAHVLALQEQLGDRAVVAVVGAGSIDDDGFRTAVEDHLAAGAVVDALAAVGIDFSSPEAAAACAAWQGLRRATAHLLTASTSGQELADARDQRREHAAAVATLREFTSRG